MNKELDRFEKISRTLLNFGKAGPPDEILSHPFDERNIHPAIADISRKLFDDGHYAQSTFEAYKLIDITVKNISGIRDAGFSLMMNAFSDKNTKIKLTKMLNTSEIDEQKGFMFIFAGSMSAIRNPRGHDIVVDTIDICLDHLSLASTLLRRLERRFAP